MNTREKSKELLGKGIFIRQWLVLGLVSVMMLFGSSVWGGIFESGEQCSCTNDMHEDNIIDKKDYDNFKQNNEYDSLRYDLNKNDYVGTEDEDIIYKASI